MLACFLPQWNYLRVRGEYGGSACVLSPPMELPPRARRIRLGLHGFATRTVNHLRVRGEYVVLGPRGRCAWELPPRARRIRLRLLSLLHGLGTTSACAENTLGKSYPEAPHGNYLRVRGEYILDMTCGARLMELPPRARRIRNDDLVDGAPGGTTSACAENTFSPPSSGIDCGNYLRVRGEYGYIHKDILKPVELPPRARRIPSDAFLLSSVVGTTSACAENTSRNRNDSSSSWNYLRVRGEYESPKAAHLLSQELPPRARRILCHAEGVMAAGGTTSACAENTHLRLRNIIRSRELPPRARRIHAWYSAACNAIGTTSACAENTE